MDLLADCRKGRARLPQLGVLYVNEFVCHGRENEALSNEGVHYYANKKLRFSQTRAGRWGLVVHVCGVTDSPQSTAFLEQLKYHLNLRPPLAMQ